MGVPKLFSYIVQNYSKILKKLSKNTIPVNNLYLDSNSIIYDAVHNIDFTKLVESDVKTIINTLQTELTALKAQFKTRSGMSAQGFRLKK
jgi:5'-3' exonuclease